jgi:hypothetical protein
MILICEGLYKDHFFNPHFVKVPFMKGIVP